jgi:hypothetical protein
VQDDSEESLGLFITDSSDSGSDSSGEGSEDGGAGSDCSNDSDTSDTIDTDGAVRCSVPACMWSARSGSTHSQQMASRRQHHHRGKHIIPTKQQKTRVRREKPAKKTKPVKKTRPPRTTKKERSPAPVSAKRKRHVPEEEEKTTRPSKRTKDDEARESSSVRRPDDVESLIQARRQLMHPPFICRMCGWINPLAVDTTAEERSASNPSADAYHESHLDSQDHINQSLVFDDIKALGRDTGGLPSFASAVSDCGQAVDVKEKIEACVIDGFRDAFNKRDDAGAGADAGSFNEPEQGVLIGGLEYLQANSHLLLKEGGLVCGRADTVPCFSCVARALALALALARTHPVTVTDTISRSPTQTQSQTRAVDHGHYGHSRRCGDGGGPKGCRVACLARV